ncbi:MAG TPA: hypothetical protein VG965_02420 [Patescibacteria group bacterium]|nr:hypothetical protein [Patescibacteria group bacterium]
MDSKIVWLTSENAPTIRSDLLSLFGEGEFDVEEYRWYSLDKTPNYDWISNQKLHSASIVRRRGHQPTMEIKYSSTTRGFSDTTGTPMFIFGPNSVTIVGWYKSEVPFEICMTKHPT